MSKDEVVVATAADEGYAIPLAVTVRSLLDSLASDTRLRLVLLDGGITPQSRERLTASWADPRVTLDWRTHDIRAFDGLPVDGHITAATYLRLMLPKLLPRDMKRVIYVDSDVLFRRDVTALWAEPQGGAPILAVQDLAAPFLDSELVTPNYAQKFPYLAATRPIANYQALGLRPESPYCNTGLMVLDLDIWRNEQIADKVVRCLKEQAQHVLWWDQYALNAVLSGRWRQLDPRWNQGAHVYIYPSWRVSPLGREAFEQLRDDPWIVHFCSPEKPWRYGCRHPFCGEFYATLDRTAWSGWRPAAREDEVLAAHRRYLAKVGKVRFRQKVKNAMGALRGIWKRAA